MTIDPLNIGSVSVGVIAALSAWATSRSSSKANMMTAGVSSRLDAEKEAYERARAFDLDTIKRQDEEIASLRSDNESLKAELKAVMQRLARLEKERGFPKLEEMLRERLKDEPTTDQ